MQCDRVTLFMVNHISHDMWTRFGGHDTRISLDVGLAGWVARNGLPIYIDDAQMDSRFDKKVDSVTGYTTNNILFIPLSDQRKRICGVLECVNKTRKDIDPISQEEITIVSAFTTEDKVMALLLASQLGISLGHIREDDLRKKRICVLKDAINAPELFCSVTQGSLDPENLSVIRVVEKMEVILQDILKTPYTKLFFLEHHEHHARPKGSGPAPKGLENRLWYITKEIDSVTFRKVSVKKFFSTGSGIAGEVVTTEDLVVIPNVLNDQRYNTYHDLNTHGMGLIAVPIRSPFTSSAIGVVQVGRADTFGAETVGDYTPEERRAERESVESVVELAAQVAMTFETFQIVEAERELLEHERQIAIRDNEKVLRRLFQKWRREKEAEEGKFVISINRSVP